MSQLIICRSNADCVIGAADGVAVAIWMRDTNPEDVTALAEAARRAHRGPQRWVKLLQIVTDTAITPDARSRSALALMLRSQLGVVSHSVIVHEADGFRAAMIRSIVTGVTALSNPGFPHRVFARLPEAAAWMCEGSATALSGPLDSRPLQAHHILSAVQRVRTAGGSSGSTLSSRAADQRSPSLDCR